MPTQKIAALAAALRTGNRNLIRQIIQNDHSHLNQLITQMLQDPKTAPSFALEIIENLRNRTERFMTTLSTIITAAPLLGILGTVIGIIQSFELLGQSRMTNDPTLVSAGIAQALLTTAAGLIIALITLFPYMTFKTYIDRALGQFEIILTAFDTGFNNTPQQQTQPKKPTPTTTSPK